VTTLREGDITVPFGVEVKVELVFKNTGNEAITVKPFPPPMYIVQESSLRPVRFLEAGEQGQEILPSADFSYTLIWDQKESSGEQAASGWYTIYVGEVTVFKESESQEIRPSFPPVARLYIQSP